MLFIKTNQKRIFMKSIKTKNYSVYVLKAPNGMVFAGSTSMKPYQRWNNGNGFAANPKFAPIIQECGWGSIQRKVLGDLYGKEEARGIEALFASVVKPDMLLNNTGIQREPSETAVAFAKGVQAQTFFEFMGNAVDQQRLSVVLGECPPTPAEQHFDSDNKQTNQSVTIMRKEKKSVAKTAKIAGVKVELLTDNRYKNSEGKYAICVRVYGDRKYVYIPTGYSMTTDEFANMGAEDERSLDLVFARVCAYVREKTDNGAFCIDCVKRGLSGETAAPSTTLAELLMERGCMHNNKGTIGVYKKASNAVLKVYPNGLPLKSVNSETVARLSYDMEGKLGLSATTRGIYLGAVKSAINYGIYKKMMNPSQYPFKRNPYEIDKVTLPKSEKRDDNYLTAGEMQTLWNWFAANPRRGVGYFFFSYLHGGINIADIMGLGFTDFYFDEGGFSYQRRKTIRKNQFKVYVPATTHTATLFSVLSITPSRGELVFPELFVKGGEDEFYKQKENATNRANRDLKKAAAECGIDKNITMTTARHTFATLANKSGMPYDMVERAMGHANNGVSGHYIGAWSLPEMRPEFEKLL